MTDLPDISSPAIRAGILRLEAKRRDGQKRPLECLRECFDLVASPRLDAQGTLSEAELNRVIPEMVIEAAVEFGWVECPWQRQVRRRRTNPNSWIPGAPVIDWVSVPIPDGELVENLGRFKVVAGFTAWFQNRLAGRIAHWQGEAASPLLAVAGPSKPSAPLNSPEDNVTSQPRGKGRPTVIPDERKQRALAAHGGKARAQILYATKYPTPQQVKNVSSIIRHYRGKCKPNQG